MHLYSCTGTATAWKILFYFIGLIKFPFIDSRLIAVHAFARRNLISLSVDEISFLRYGNLSTDFMVIAQLYGFK